MKGEKTERTHHSSEETKQGAPDKRTSTSFMCGGDAFSVSHPSTTPNGRKLASPSQAFSGRESNTVSSNSQSSSYSIEKWLNQTRHEEPWNPAGCSTDFYYMGNTNGAPDPTTCRGFGNQNSNGSK